MHNTFQTLILPSAKDWTVKSQVSKPCRLLIEAGCFQMRAETSFPPCPSCPSILVTKTPLASPRVSCDSTLLHSWNQLVLRLTLQSHTIDTITYPLSHSTDYSVPQFTVVGEEEEEEKVMEEGKLLDEVDSLLSYCVHTTLLSPGVESSKEITLLLWLIYFLLKNHFILRWLGKKNSLLLVHMSPCYMSWLSVTYWLTINTQVHSCLYIQATVIMKIHICFMTKWVEFSSPNNTLKHWERYLQLKDQSKQILLKISLDTFPVIAH